MHGDALLPQVADRVCLSTCLDRANEGHPAEAELGEEDEQPVLAGLRGGLARLGQPLQPVAERLVHTAQVEPLAAGGIAEPFGGGEVVVRRGAALEVTAARRDALKQAIGQQPALQADADVLLGQARHRASSAPAGSAGRYT